MKRLPFAVGFILICFSILSSSDLPGLVHELVETDTKKRQQELIEEIVSHEPASEMVCSLLKSLPFYEPEKRGIIKEEIRCIDGKTRPFFWYIPDSYDPAKKSPLLIYLHGGVSRKEIIENPEAYVSESPFIPLADKEGYILLFPLGQIEATWWDSVGVDNVLSQIRLTKKQFNIDDNRVYMTGFSDGASGSFFFGMCHPTDFAAFLPLNGHPGVGSIDGGIHTFFVNLFNRPLSVINTDEDALYPSSKMSPMMELALQAGADLLFRIYTGIPHTFGYAEKEIPLMQNFMEIHPRIPHPPFIKWETVEKRHGRCNWLRVESVKPGSVPDWHEDHNMKLIDNVVAFGFYPDDGYKGEGIRMEKVVDSTFVALAGANDGDIVIAVGNDSVTGMKTLNDYKAKKERGDPAEITVLRNGDKFVLKGHFPPPKEYDLFRRVKPSAHVEALFDANNFRIRASQLGSFSLNIHPDMVQLDQYVLIYVNDRLCFDERVEPDIEFLLRNFLEHRDRELLYVNRISINTH